MSNEQILADWVEPVYVLLEDCNFKKASMLSTPYSHKFGVLNQQKVNTHLVTVTKSDFRGKLDIVYNIKATGNAQQKMDHPKINQVYQVIEGSGEYINACFFSTEFENEEQKFSFGVRVSKEAVVTNQTRVKDLVKEIFRILLGNLQPRPKRTRKTQSKPKEEKGLGGMPADDSDEGPGPAKRSNPPSSSVIIDLTQDAD